MNLERILKQHKEILELSNKLEEYINKLEVQNSDKNLLSEILLKKSFLMGKLKVHLLTEEIYFNNLQIYNKQEYKEIINKMNELPNKIKEFDQIYKNISTNKENLYSFIIQLKDIIHNLKNRISIENQNVYSKIEK